MIYLPYLCSGLLVLDRANITFPRLVARIESENDNKVVSIMSDGENAQNIQVFFINIGMMII